MRFSTCLGGILGLALLGGIVIRADVPAILKVLESAGTSLLWLVPYRAFFFLFYALGWFVLLLPCNAARRASLGYLFWVTTVREGIDRLLPVASVGGSVIGIRLVRWRGLDAAAVLASVIVEIFLTVVVSYLFAGMGLLLWVGSGSGVGYRPLLWILLVALPVPVISLLLLRYGSIFARLRQLLRPLLGERISATQAGLLDLALRAALRRLPQLGVAGTLQLAALCSAAFETWFALRSFGHPVDVTRSLILESLIMAVRHVAFIIPSGVGVQEAGLIIAGQAMGVDQETALALSLAKRLRELAWGLPALLSWQWAEIRRLAAPRHTTSP